METPAQGSAWNDAVMTADAAGIRLVCLPALSPASPLVWAESGVVFVNRCPAVCEGAITDATFAILNELLGVEGPLR